MKLFDIVTGTATQPRLSGNMLPNLKTKMRIWMVEFLTFEIRGIKIARVISMITVWLEGC